MPKKQYNGLISHDHHFIHSITAHHPHPQHHHPCGVNGVSRLRVLGHVEGASPTKHAPVCQGKGMKHMALYILQFYYIGKWYITVKDNFLNACFLG